MKKAVIVSGGAQGIGSVIVDRLLEAGYAAAVLDADREALAEASAKYPGRDADFLPLAADVSKEEEVAAAVHAAGKKFGVIRGLVNNAAVSRNGPLRDLRLEDWNLVLGTNLTGPFLLAKHAAPYLARDGGSIVNICSTRALMSEPGTEAYSASKGGLLALTHALAMSLGPRVRVNAVSPGWIEVSAYKKASRRKEPALSDADHSQHPAGRVGEPGDIARMVLFLLAEENSFITGQNFVVDGGMTKKMIYV
jgi:NAD(P)-dependent dehydrogenase (short-subunit alcohol dehydrogenase family)